MDRVEGKVMNCGKAGGVVTVNFMGLLGSSLFGTLYMLFESGKANHFIWFKVVKNVR
ncbi:MAG: hypothetical protein ACLU4N_25710 [Butyricimonas faecihominis]